MYTSKETYSRTEIQLNYGVESNHLGNVLVTVSARPRLIYDVNDDFLYKEADVTSVSDYYPGGMPMPGRDWTGGTGFYRFGHNTQEKVDEWNGTTGTHYTALFWEYDSRLIWRQNPDPKGTADVSQYSCFGGNPIFFSDVLGDTIRFKTPEDFRNVLYGAIQSTAFAQKVNTLRKSENTYTYNDNHRTGGVVGYIEKTDECQYELHYSTNSQSQYNHEGKSPYHSLFEETFHAVDYENNVEGVSFNDNNVPNIMIVKPPEARRMFEATANKWVAENAPGSKESISWYYKGVGTISTEQTLIKQMKTSDIKTISKMLFEGYSIPIKLPNGNNDYLDVTKPPYRD